MMASPTVAGHKAITGGIIVEAPWGASGRIRVRWQAPPLPVYVPRAARRVATSDENTRMGWRFGARPADALGIVACGVATVCASSRPSKASRGGHSASGQAGVHGYDGSIAKGLRRSRHCRSRDGSCGSISRSVACARRALPRPSTAPPNVSPGLAQHIDAQGMELARLPEDCFEIDEIGSSWADYIDCRDAIPVSLPAFTGALSVPLTILRMLNVVGYRFERGDIVRVDLPGSRVLELCNLEASFAELGRAFPYQDVHVRLVGPQLRGGYPDGAVIEVDNVTVTLHRGLYQDLLASCVSGAPLPHLAVAFHAGIQEYGTWIQAVTACAHLRIPLAVTGYSLSDITAGLRDLLCAGQPMAKVAREGFNPFACSERMLINEVSEQITMLGGTGADEEDGDLLLGAPARQQLVEDAGGLMQLAEVTSPDKAAVVSINSWWYLLWDEKVQGEADQLEWAFAT